MAAGPAFLFDLDGTLIDSVYQHVLAWREALETAGIESQQRSLEDQRRGQPSPRREARWYRSNRSR